MNKANDTETGMSLYKHFKLQVTDIINFLNHSCCEDQDNIQDIKS